MFEEETRVMSKHWVKTTRNLWKRLLMVLMSLLFIGLIALGNRVALDAVEGVSTFLVILLLGLPYLALYLLIFKMNYIDSD